ncbi:MAG: EamA family transporter [Lachnospiraceae bacterium]|nr:EamA family transporter [Lachnospiraceae bacterium]
MSKTGAKLLLLAVFAARGTSFIFSKTLLATQTPENIMAVRFLTAFLVLALVFRKKVLACSRESLKGGIILGVLYMVCMFCEMYGLRRVDSGVAAFIENMAIILVPIYVALLTRTRPKTKTLLCALIAVIGVGFLSLSQVTDSFNPYLLLTISAALSYGVCIIATEKVAAKGDPLTIGIIQIGVMGLIALAAALIKGDFALPASGREWFMVLMLALVCSCFGFAFQPVGQKYLPSETAAVFTVVNPLVASILGLVVAKEPLGPAKIIGYLLILAALIYYNLETGKHKAQAADKE